MKTLRIVIIMSLSSCVLISVIMAGEPIKVRVSDYPPSYYKDKSGHWVGVEIDVIKALLNEAQLDFKFIELPWKRAIKYIESGKIDILLSLSKTSEREEFIDFIGVSKYEQMGLIVREDNMNLRINMLDDLTKFKKNFGVQYGVFYPKLTQRIDKDKGFEKHFEFVPDESLNLRKTLEGRILGFFEDRMYAIYAIKNNPQFKDLAVHSFSLTKPSPVYIGASRKTSKEIRTKLKKAYQSLERKGAIKIILEKWN